MTERDLVVGSASPPTADVPTGQRRPAYDAVYAYIHQLGAAMPADPVRRNAMIWSAVRLSLDAVHHSGVAGEPEATAKEASEINSEPSPTQLPVPTPDSPGAADVAGGVVVSYEVRDAANRAAFGAYTRWTMRPNREAYVYEAIGAAAADAVTAAAPLIVEHYLRQRIKAASVESTPEVVWEQVRLMARNAALRAAAADALRVVYWQLRERTSAFRTAGGNGSYALGLEEATAAVEERLDELERGTDG